MAKSSGKGPPVERRKCRHVGLVTEVRCKRDGTEKILQTRDISEGGIFVSTHEPLSPGSEVSIRLLLSGTGTSVEVEGRVGYNVPELGMGIEFTSMGREAQKNIHEFVQHSSKMED